MSIDPGIATKLPGDTSIDLFPTPDLNSDDFEYEPLAFNFVPHVSPIQIATDETPVKNIDLLLADTLKIFGVLTSTNISRNVKVIKSSSNLAQQMLSYIKMSDGQYTGPVSPTSNYSCQMIAAKLKDRFDLTSRRLIRNRFIENDYFGIIAYEVSKGRTLIAFDKNWVLPAIANYIEEQITYDMEKPASLRERIATYNPMSLNPEEPIAQWDQIPNLHGELFTLDDLTIYPFHDTVFGTAEGCQSEACMVFAPIDLDEAEKIYLYLYRNVQLYTDVHYLTLRDVSIEKVKDFQYLFPVDLKYLGHYAVISTNKMTRDRLEQIYQLGEIAFDFPRLNELTGAYATYLLAESMFFQYSMRWERNILLLGLCGYIQALDLVENFGQILNEIEKETPYYKILPNYSTAAYLAATTDCKCFHYNGKYYAVLYEDMDIPTIETPSPKEISRIELICPLLAITRQDTAQQAKVYFQSLGYDVNPSPDPYSNDLQLGFRTLEINGETSTTYFYQATHKNEVDLHETKGPYNDEVRIRLELLLRNGYFFIQKVRNITRGYPEFIPSTPPISRQLSENPSDLIVQLDNLIRGSKIVV